MHKNNEKVQGDQNQRKAQLVKIQHRSIVHFSAFVLGSDICGSVDHRANLTEVPPFLTLQENCITVG